LVVITSLLFFGSVMFHELSHSLVAKHYKIPVASITLFVFGGFERIGREPSSAKQEFNIAIAGPISSFFLSAVFYFVAHYSGNLEMFVTTSLLLIEVNFLLSA